MSLLSLVDGMFNPANQHQVTRHEAPPTSRMPTASAGVIAGYDFSTHLVPHGKLIGITHSGRTVYSMEQMRVVLWVAKEPKRSAGLPLLLGRVLTMRTSVASA